VIWIFDNKESIYYIVKIFTKYPPLTSKLNCQLEFLKACLANNLFLKIYLKNVSLHYFLNKRRLKFSSQFSIVEKLNNRFIIPNYFCAWLSGFIETKGSFSVYIKKDNSYYYSFSIKHNNDYYILYSIYNLCNMTVKIKNIHDKSYFLKTYKKEIINKIINHCISYPLLGEKSKYINQFKKVFYR